MSLVADVRNTTGRTRHRNASHAGVVDVPMVISVRIEPVDGTFFLFRFDVAGNMVADTWHQSIREAQDQAHFEYNILPDDWNEATDADHNRSDPTNTGAQ